MFRVYDRDFFDWNMYRVPATNAAFRRRSETSVPSVQSDSEADPDHDRFLELNDIIGTLHKGRCHKSLYSLLPCAVFVLFLTSSLIFGYYLSYKRELSDQENLFEIEFNGVANGVVDNVLRSFSLAKDVGFLLGFLFEVRAMSCTEFEQVARAAVHTATEGNAFLRGFSFNPIVNNTDRDLFEGIYSSSNSSLYNCAGGQSPNVHLGIWSRNASHNNVRVPEADFYVPVLLIYPTESNKGAIGFDIYSTGSRRSAIDRSIQSGVAATTDIISLVQTNTSGCLLLSPVHNKTSNETIGFATLVIDFSLFTANISHGLVTDIDVVISSSAESSMSYHIINGNDKKPIETRGVIYDASFKDLVVSGQTTIGRTWTVSVYPSQQTKNRFVTASLSTSMGLSVLLFTPTIIVFLVYTVLLCNFKVDIQKKVRAYARTTVADARDIFNLPAGDVGLPNRQELIKPREMKRSSVKLLENIGEGAFGGVWKAFYDSRKDGLQIPPSLIAVKTCKIPEQSNALLREAVTMAQVDAHDNVVTLIGVVTKELPFMICQIYCEFGSLDAYLIDKANEAKQGKRRPISLELRLDMLNDTAKGMAHIISKNFVHRDLAARNVLVDSALICRVADFGLTRFLDQLEEDESKDYYRCSGKGVYPVRWTAPEAMESGRFTEANDVWSWGVLAWEVFTDAQKPYPNVANNELFEFVQSSKVLEKPDSCPRIIYNLQLDCWNLDPLLRPTFADIVAHRAWDSHDKYGDNYPQLNTTDNHNFGSKTERSPSSRITPDHDRSFLSRAYEYDQHETTV
eukprot:m.62900 g.62900  ORF g.62900 m.62900 type:complete len:796 (+) comp23217_c0_seq1:243-2630(+)